MTAADLHDLILTTLVKEKGGTRRRWRIVLGALKRYDPATHPHCNWSVAPSGGVAENDAVEDVLDRLRLSHPIVTAG